MDFDKFGYYIGAGRKTYSRIEAMEYAKGNDIEWNFNDEVFSIFDWTQEPLQDLNYFYDLRAQQLRNQYDYIVLFYSGGYDSHNILKTFIDNNLHIDEVLTMIPSLETFSTPTIEYKKYTLKKIEKYKTQLSNTKFRLIEYRESLLREMKKMPDLLYELNYKHTLYHKIKERFKYEIEEHAKIIESGKKIVYLYGVDKPQIVVSHDKFFFEFRDSSVANKVLSSVQYNKIADVHYEFFYWDPSCVPMIIKQAHAIKKLYKQTKCHISSNLPQFNYTIYSRCFLDDYLGYFDENSFRNMFLSANRSRGVNRIACIGGRDSWFYTSEDEIVKKAIYASHYIAKKYINHIDGTNLNDYIHKSLSKRYFIGE